MANYPTSIWTYEGVAYNAFLTPQPGTVPLYRFWSPLLSGHFYTASESEKNSIVAGYPASTWSFEGVAFYVYPPNTSVTGTVAVSRFWSPTNQHHFYTASIAEKNSVIANYPAAIWTYEGDTFRVPSGSPVTAPVVPVTSVTSTAGFPSGSSTGVPAGTGLSAYAGPCTVTVASTVIDAKTINCSRLEIRAKNVTITRSVLNGTVYADPDLGIGSFTISDSQVNVGAQAGTGIGDGNFTALRVHVTGGNRSINCSLNCTVQASYVHGQFADHTGVYHESGIRIGSGSVLRGNTVACDAPDIAPDAGCSAAITGYGDFAIVQNDTIDGNLIIAGSGGYCTYGGSTTGKPYSTGTNNILYTNNVYQRGPSGKCGSYGPITSFDTTAPGNIWSNNTWDNGTPVTAAN